MATLKRHRILLLALVGVLGLLTFVGITVYRQGLENIESTQWVEHTHEVLGELSATMSAAQDVWGSSRGYVITGRESYLLPFNEAKQQIPGRIHSLRRLTADSAEQQGRLNKLESLLNARIEISERHVATYRAEGQAAAEEEVRRGEGKQVMDGIRELIAEMEATERRLLMQRTSELRAHNERTLQMFLLLTVALGGLLFLAAYLVHREAGAKQRQLELIEQARSHAANIVDTLREPILVLDRELRVLSANRSFYKTFHTTPADTEGKLLYEYGNREWDIPELRKALGEVLLQHASFDDFEVEQDFPEMGRRTIILNARKMFRVGNNTNSILLAFEDITERKRAHEELGRVFDLSLDPICVAGFDGRFKRLNPAWERTLGFTREELFAMPYLEFVHPEDREATAAEAAKLAKGLATISFENRYRCKDGSYRWFSWNAAPVTGCQLIYAVAHDITERKQEETRLQSSHAELRSRFDIAIRASGQLLYEWDVSADAVSYGNVEALGYAPEELSGGLAHWVEMIHPADHAAFHEERKRSLDTRRPFHQEYRLRRKDGRYICVEDRGYLTFDQGGSVAGMIGFVADISERKQLEEQFRQVQKMEAIGQLAGGVAHDFNNLLNVISGYSELLGDQITEERTLGFVKEIRKASDRAAGLTRQLLAFSRKQVLEPRVLNLNSIISDVSKMLHRLIGEDIKLVILAASDLGRVRVDPSQIEQVILNLAVNAREAMPRGGTLTIETANVELDQGYAQRHISVVPGRYVMIAFSDTGVGMDATTQARIFEPFFTTKKEGTGLGLATVYGIVKQSGGNIWVYSEPHKGSTFKVYLPRVEAVVQVTSPVASSVLPRGSETILLAEDAQPLRLLVREFLESAGYSVLEASDGSDAIRLAQQCSTPIRLLLTDVVMPGLSGRQVAEAVQHHHPNIRVLYMSGYTDESIGQHGILKSGVALVSKPFTRETLVRKVREVLDSPEPDAGAE